MLAVLAKIQRAVTETLNAVSRPDWLGSEEWEFACRQDGWDVVARCRANLTLHIDLEGRCLLERFESEGAGFRLNVEDLPELERYMRKIEEAMQGLGGYCLLARHDVDSVLTGDLDLNDCLEEAIR